MDIINNLNWRYATKEFDKEKKVSDKDLEIILESLRLTPSSFGLQPWKFIIIEDQKVKDSLLEHSWNQKQVINCSHHIVMCCPTKFGDDEVDKFIEDTANTRGQETADLEGYSQMMKGFLARMSEDKKAHWMKDQVYIALGNLMSVCAFMKIDACPMEGIVQAKYDEVLGLKEKGLTSVVACPIGYRANNDKYASAKKVRFKSEDIFIKL